MLAQKSQQLGGVLLLATRLRLLDTNTQEVEDPVAIPKTFDTRPPHN